MSGPSEHELSTEHEPGDDADAGGTVPGEAGAAAPFTTFGARSNRRAKAGTIRNCRLCWKPITIEASHVEEEPPRVFFRCPHCGNAFPIRRSDVPTAATVPTSTAIASAPADAAGPPAEIWSTLERSVIDRLDLEAVRALLVQLEAVHARHGSTEESRALRDALCAREQLLIALEDVGQAVASIEAEFPPSR